MAQHILQINLEFNLSTPELKEVCADLAEAIASFPGLVWKIWMINEDQGETGGIYCFESQEALSAYLNSSIVAKVKAYPAFEEIQIKQFETLAQLTAITRGPVNLAQANFS
jgi:hypothetical protein